MAKFQQVYDEKIDAFNKIKYDNSDIKRFYREYTPVSALQDSDHNVIEFNILSSNDCFIDASKTRLRIRLQIVDSDGRGVTSKHDVGPVFDCLHSSFRSIGLSLNGQQMSDDIGSNFPFYNHINTLLSKDFFWLDSYGKSIGAILDPAYTHNSGAL